MNKFETRFKKVKFCSELCSGRYYARAVKVFGSIKNFNKWLDSNLIDWKDFNEFNI